MRRWMPVQGRKAVRRKDEQSHWEGVWLEQWKHCCYYCFESADGLN